jgi:electron transport complex protein RnfC
LLTGGRLTFRHGVHPDEGKDATNRQPIERMPFVDEYVLHLSQHTGAPSTPVVEAGDKVERGELIAKPSGFISTALHSPITGTVKAIELRPHANGQQMPAIVIETDPYASQRLASAKPPPLDEIEPADVVRRVQEAGIVGLGGAAFPSHVKLKVPEGKQVRFAVLNGCECEPYLTCDHRVMVEEADKVVRGLRIIMSQVQAERGYIGVELNKPDAIERLREEVKDDPGIEVVGLAVKYPQGAEKMLIDAIFHREVKIGGLPIDVEMLVNNVGTAAALASFFDEGQPLVERVVTVTGSGVVRPANVLVPLGTPVRDVIEFCGGLKPSTQQVIVGGPMMGMSQKTLAVPVMKGTSGIVALAGRDYRPPLEQPCIRCGRCLEACPMFLNPSRLATLTRAEAPDMLSEAHVLDCFECASCSFVCPSHIPLVQLMRVGKAMVRQKKSS